jgi:hypothetical protein
MAIGHRGKAQRLPPQALWPQKEFIRFTKVEGAEAHGQMGAVLISNGRILDWLDDIIMKGKAEKYSR